MPNSRVAKTSALFITMSDNDQSLFDHKTFLANVTEQAGVYQMFHADGKILYVGKAKNLKKRLTSYFTKANTNKTQALVRQIASIEVTVTGTEKEALLLEANLIKKHRPRYNILLKDDKAYPYLLISKHAGYPRLDVTRNRDPKQGETFGPYTSGSSVRNSIALLQKIFQLRPCQDSFFQGRSRPCLQHQIKRCSAPCVDLISPEAYQAQVAKARRFLQGESADLIADLASEMQKASERKDFEQAAALRDSLRQLQLLQQQQYIDVDSEKAEYDIIAVKIKAGLGCVSIMFVRGGRSLGNKPFYFPKLPAELTEAELLEIFLSQYYLSGKKHQLPKRVISNLKLSDKALWQESLSEAAGYSVQIMSKLRAVERNWLEMACGNVDVTLTSYLKKQLAFSDQFQALQNVLRLSEEINRIECFDISHTRGERTVASCVVFDQSGPARRAYRSFNIEDITGGDDYAAMRQALMRRYSARSKNKQQLPDLVIIDGGKGQLAQAVGVFAELEAELDAMPLLLGVAKGPKRIVGKEELWLPGASMPLAVPEGHQSRHLIEQIRDEAHRFAITRHKKRRAKARVTSVLENIPGLGPKRRQALLLHFGGIVEIKRASVAELAKVNGISRELAEQVYQALKEG